MANYQQAPKLSFDGEKNTKQFYQIPQDLADIIFQKLGNSSAQLRIMMVLIGTKEGFAITDKWICERTGLLHPSYIKARKALVERGWLKHEAAKGITVNIKAIYAENRGNTILPEEKKGNESSNTTLPQRGNMTLPHSSNTTLPQRGNTILPITYNTDKETDNKTDNKPIEKEVSQKPIEINGTRAQQMTKEEAMVKYGLGACANAISTGETNCYWINNNLVQFD